MYEHDMEVDLIGQHARIKKSRIHLKNVWVYFFYSWISYLAFVRIKWSFKLEADWILSIKNLSTRMNLLNSNLIDIRYDRISWRKKIEEQTNKRNPHSLTNCTLEEQCLSFFVFYCAKLYERLKLSSSSSSSSSLDCVSFKSNAAHCLC